MNSSNDVIRMARDLVDTVFRHKKKLFAYNVLIMLLVVLAVLFWPRKYQSQAKVWIKLGRENTKLDPAIAVGESISIQETDREDEIKSVLDVIGSRGVIEGAVERLGAAVVLGDEALPNADTSESGFELKSNPIVEVLQNSLGRVLGFVKMLDPISVKEEAIREVEENLHVDAVRKSNVVSLVYDSKYPALAQAVVGELVSVYQSEHSRIHHSRGSRAFFEEQSEKLRQRVETVSNKIKSIMDDSGIASIDGERSIVESEMLHIQTAKLDAIRGYAASKATIEKMTALLEEHPQHIMSEDKSVPNTGRDDMRTQLFALQMQRMELETKYNADNPLVQAAKAQEEQARKALSEDSTMDRSEVSLAVNAVHQNLATSMAQAKAQSVGLEATLETLEQQEAAILKRMAKLNATDIQVRELQRELALAEKNYTVYSRNVEDARVDEALNQSAISSIGIAQRPTYQEKPVSPSKLLCGLLGMASMLFGSLGIVLLMRLLESDSIRDADELEAMLEIPVMVSIPNQRRFSQVLR